MMAFVASRMSLTFSISKSPFTKFSNVDLGRLATSPPETTTSRTERFFLRYSRICSMRVGCFSANWRLGTWGTLLPTKSILVQCPQYWGQVDNSSAKTFVG